MSDSENKKKARIVEFAAGRMMKDEYKVCTSFVYYEFSLKMLNFLLGPEKAITWTWKD